MEDFRTISVIPDTKNKVTVNNPTSYPLIGQGAQGAVFRLTSHTCVKIYTKEKYARKEARAYNAVAGSPVFPKMYRAGSNYIVMEYLDGPTLYDYLEAKGCLPEAITEQLLFILEEMKRFRFSRWDMALRHIIVTRRGNLKVIDLVNSFRIRDRKLIGLFGGLRKLGLLKDFLTQARELSPSLYEEWKNSMGAYFKSLDM